MAAGLMVAMAEIREMKWVFRPGVPRCPEPEPSKSRFAQKVEVLRREMVFTIRIGQSHRVRI